MLTHISRLAGTDIQRYVSRTIAERMTQAELEVPSIFFPASYLLREPFDTPQYHNSVRGIMEDHRDFWDDQLVTILYLNSAFIGHTERPLAVKYYLRSWSLTQRTLRRMLTVWLEEETEFEEVEDWLAKLSTMYPWDRFHVRYVGMTRGEPIRRHIQDVESRGGFLGKFLQTLYTVDRQAFEGVQIYEFTQARMPLLGSTSTTRDLQEQSIIAFFGVDKLLNIQHGGQFFSYQPSEEQRNILMQTRGQFFHLFEQHANSDQHLVESLRPWVEEIRTEITMHQLPSSADIFTMLRQQATPLSVRGCVVLALVGYDITFGDYMEARPFFEQSRAGLLTKQLLAAQKAYADGRTEWRQEDFMGAAFPFVDAFPWLDTSNARNAGVRQLTHYLNLVQPLVVVTFSREVTSLAFADFLHSHGLTHQPGPRFLKHVGVPRLVYLLDEEWLESSGDEEERQQRVAIIVPHFDPGYERYGPRSQELIHLMELTWSVTFIIAEMVLNCILEVGGSRRQMIERIWPSIMDGSLLDPRLQRLYRDIEQLKANIISERVQNLRRQPRNVAETRSELWRDIVRQNMSQHGVAEGAPGSLERRQQVERLWRMNMPSLHIHLDRSDKQSWVDWAITRNEGTSYFASAMRYVGASRTHPCYNALRQFAPEGAADDGSWLYDEELMTQAASQWGAWMKQFLPADHFSSQNQRHRVTHWLSQQSEEYEYTATMEGRLIYVPATWAARLRWLDGSIERTLQLKFPNSLFDSDRKEDRMCRLRFLPEGIGLESEDGEQLGVRALRNLTYLRAQEDGAHLVRLWQQERLRLGDTTAGTEIIPGHADVPANQRRKPLQVSSGERSKEPFRQFIYDTDALGLLRRFLDQRFLQGGYVNLAPPNLQPHISTESIAFQAVFDRFLRRHTDHPHYHTWHAWNSDISKWGRHYFVNIELLRPGSTKHDHWENLPAGSRRRCSHIRIAPRP
ncbi:uncharacterized protein BYT42DRAFT_639990 [Radiomyces spectabilis]|uniref:uncharacterized protein n=1 Tax=Radiomyces spectabilis TaxID=64574 RepID=UPI002221065C|nr:uncharacterized protein BYT42DRAFT_639990 [Radiomyces spectabilis]KAI8374597.1 hypothetical protein BYT42DRAFT_639990 [Radiomyces spectabilis]